MTVIEEYSGLIRLLDARDRLSGYPLGTVYADAAKAITELAARCQAAEDIVLAIDRDIGSDYKGPKVRKPTKLPQPIPRN